MGYNLKATEMQASLGVSQLDKLQSFIQSRRNNHAKILAGLESIPKMPLIPIQSDPICSPSWFGFPMLCDPSVDRSKLLQFLESKGIGTRLVFGGNLTRQPVYQDVKYRIVQDLSGTDQVMDRAFWIGVHPALNDSKINYMIEQIKLGIV